MVHALFAVSSVSVGLVLFMWALIVVCYIRYRKLHRAAHQKAAFKVPGAAFTPWMVLAFFGFVVYLLLRYDDTRFALLCTLLWFVGLTFAWLIKKRVIKRRLLAAKAAADWGKHS